MKVFKTIDQNDYGRDFVVGDLHGCYEEFQKALKWQNFDPEIDRVFSVGDLVDRGPDSLSCLSLLEENWFHCVKGNHEILWLKAHKFWLQDFDDAFDDRIDLEIWCKVFLQNGGEIINDPKIYIKYKKLIEELPSIIELKHRSGKKFGILHAELPIKFTDWGILKDMTDEEIEKTLGPSLYWGRARYTSKTLLHPLVENIDRIYVGHTIVDGVIDIGNFRYLDTGAFLVDGKLTMELVK